MARAYVCDACGAVIENPHGQKMREFKVNASYEYGEVFPIEAIKIPSYLAHSTPSEDKIVRRFLEYYRTGQFNTRVTVDDGCVLTDGYTAYKVAKMLHLTHLIAVAKG